MVIVKEVYAKSILDSRKEKTIEVHIKTNIGSFFSSSPNGKSTGKNAVKVYKKNIEGDIKTLKKFSEYFSDEKIDKFDDLRRIEDILDGNVGANKFIAFEYAILKALAKEKKKEIWQLINSSAKKMPRLLGNCVGGGKHAHIDKKPDFQEFLLIPKTKTLKEAFELNKKIRERIKTSLKLKDKKFKGEISDEKAWQTSLNERQVLDIISEQGVDIGLDIAASSFYKRKKYNYKNPLLKRTAEEQFGYVSNLIKNFNIFYIEDGMDEEDFDGFGKLLKTFPNSLIVGDDLTVTTPKRLEKAIKEKSINGIIVKPNQIGSLIKVKQVVEMAKKNKIKIAFSHRSGETNESVLADLAFGFGADFFKCGIVGKERETKLKRLVEIERGLR